MTNENKDKADMILRDYLAVDRTRLANQRTLLSMIRTGLYFLVMGLSIISLEYLEELKKYSIVFFVLGLIVMVIGLVNYRRNEKRIINLYESKRA